MRVTCSEAMLQAVRRGFQHLDDAAAARTARFCLQGLGAAGGFKDRSGQEDLYYTVFGIDCVRAAGEALPASRIERFLQSFGDGGGLDFVHLAALARCWGRVREGRLESELRDVLTRRLGGFRSGDGAFHTAAGAPRGSVYGCFLAMLAYEDLGVALPDPGGVVECVASLRADSGGYANAFGDAGAGTPASSAAGLLLARLTGRLDPGLGAWLKARHHRTGGFMAGERAPAPDLLSTATALYALRVLNVPVGDVVQGCMDFIEGLWHEDGGFRGHAADRAADGEYTYYGLLAIGSLAG